MVRILIVNPNRLQPDDNEKIEQFTESIVDLQINVALISSSNCKWNEYTIESMNSKLKSVYYKVESITADSKDHSCTNLSYLPGGIMSSWWNSAGAFINKEKSKFNDLGR